MSLLAVCSNAPISLPYGPLAAPSPRPSTLLSPRPPLHLGRRLGVGLTDRRRALELRAPRAVVRTVQQLPRAVKELLWVKLPRLLAAVEEDLVLRLAWRADEVQLLLKLRDLLLERTAQIEAAV
jgi:hypothetical protein